MNNLEKKHQRILSGIDENTLKMMKALPVNCSCPICVLTKQRIKDDIGEKRFLASMEGLGKSSSLG